MCGFVESEAFTVESEVGVGSELAGAVCVLGYEIVADYVCDGAALCPVAAPGVVGPVDCSVIHFLDEGGAVVGFVAFVAFFGGSVAHYEADFITDAVEKVVLCVDEIDVEEGEWCVAGSERELVRVEFGQVEVGVRHVLAGLEAECAFVEAEHSEHESLYALYFEVVLSLEGPLVGVVIVLNEGRGTGGKVLGFYVDVDVILGGCSDEEVFPGVVSGCQQHGCCLDFCLDVTGVVFVLEDAYVWVLSVDGEIPVVVHAL